MYTRQRRCLGLLSCGPSGGRGCIDLRELLDPRRETEKASSDGIIVAEESVARKDDSVDEGCVQRLASKAEILRHSTQGKDSPWDCRKDGMRLSSRRRSSIKDVVGHVIRRVGRDMCRSETLMTAESGRAG